MKELKFIILKDDEFAVLCALYGITHFFGSLEVKASHLSKQEIYTTLHQLHKKELLKGDQDKVILSPEAKRICEGISRATRLLSLVGPLTSENHSFYYNPHTSECINLQKSWQDPHSIRVRCMPKEEIITICEETEMFPKQALDEANIKDIQLEEDETIHTQYLRLNVYDLATDESIVELLVGRAVLNTVLEYSDAVATYKKVYELEHLKQMITTLLQGEKNHDNG